MYDNDITNFNIKITHDFVRRYIIPYLLLFVNNMLLLLFVNYNVQLYIQIFLFNNHFTFSFYNIFQLLIDV